MRIDIGAGSLATEGATTRGDTMSIEVKSNVPGRGEGRDRQTRPAVTGPQSGIASA